MCNKFSIMVLIMVTIQSCSQNSYDFYGDKVFEEKIYYDTGELLAELGKSIVSDTSVLNGYYTSYFMRGQIKEESAFHLGKRIGSSYYYEILNEGHFLKEMKYHDPLGRLLYRSKYDLEGNAVIIEGGHQMIPQVIFLNKCIDADSARIQVLYPEIPHLEEAIHIIHSEDDVVNTFENCKNGMFDLYLSCSVRSFLLIFNYFEHNKLVYSDTLEYEIQNVFE